MLHQFWQGLERSCRSQTAAEASLFPAYHPQIRKYFTLILSLPQREFIYSRCTFAWKSTATSTVSGAARTWYPAAAAESSVGEGGSSRLGIPGRLQRTCTRVRLWPAPSENDTCYLQETSRAFGRQRSNKLYAGIY